MGGHEFSDRVARYIHANFAALGLEVYTEVAHGKTIIGKSRRLDVFVLRPADQRALGIECKYQGSQGTTDEKIPYALQDLEAMWIPGALVYGGGGWSAGVLHTLASSRLAVRCEPADDLSRSADTVELDHVLAAVFGLWDRVLPAERRLVGDAQLDLPLPRLAKVKRGRRRRQAEGE
ncbi:MAG: PD-(D/E)XK nuclease superfamily protein [Nannocystaceae bacterium]